MPEEYTVNSDHKLTSYKKFVDDIYDQHKYVTFYYKLGKPRTLKQNDAMHSFFTDIADRCNDAGYWFIVNCSIFKKEIQVPWTQDNVKKFIWMPVQSALYPSKSESTRQLDTTEVSMVARTVMDHLSQNHSIYVIFGKDQ